MSGGSFGTAASPRGRYIILYLRQAHGIKIRVAVWLQVVGGAYPGISHYCRTAPGLIRILQVYSIRAAISANIIIKRMRCPIFMPHFVGHVIYVKTIPYGVSQAGDAISII